MANNEALNAVIGFLIKEPKKWRKTMIPGSNSFVVPIPVGQRV